jgi:hypothetical protein
MRFFGKAGQSLVGYDYSNYYRLIELEETSYNDFEFTLEKLSLPGVLFNNIFFLSMVYSSFLVFYDKMSASFERISVAGVTPTESYLAHVMHNAMMIFMLVPSTMIVVFYVFDTPLNGRVWEVYALIFMICLEGMCFGTSITR